jgi:hypothetical protein
MDTDGPTRGGRAERGEHDPFYETVMVASATECTGLMPSLPETEDEDENYAALYATHSAPRKKRDRKKS